MLKNMVILDTETTGLKSPDPVELGILILDSEFNTVKQHQSYWKPNKKVEPGAFEVHKILPEKYENSPNCNNLDLHDVLELDKEEKIYIFGSNIAYDYRVIKKPDNIHLIELKMIAKLAFPNCASYSLGKIYEAICRDKGLSISLLDDRHSAVGDCHVAHEVLLFCIEVLRKSEPLTKRVLEYLGKEYKELYPEAYEYLSYKTV